MEYGKYCCLTFEDVLLGSSLASLSWEAEAILSLEGGIETWAYLKICVYNNIVRTNSFRLYTTYSILSVVTYKITCTAVHSIATVDGYLSGLLVVIRKLARCMVLSAPYHVRDSETAVRDVMVTWSHCEGTGGRKSRQGGSGALLKFLRL